MEEYTSLSKEEKTHILKSQIKNLQYSKYTYELSIITENAIDEPNPVNILEAQKQLEIILDKENALLEELAKVELEPDSEYI